MATAEPSGPAARASLPAPRPSGTGAAGPPTERSGIGVPRLGERTPAAVEKRGPYMVARAPSSQARLQKHRDLAKAVLRRKGMLGAAPNRPDSSGKRSVKFNKGYTALSQSPDENLVSLDSDSDGELESRYSSGYSSAEASPEHLSVVGLGCRQCHCHCQMLVWFLLCAWHCARLPVCSPIFHSTLFPQQKFRCLRSTVESPGYHRPLGMEMTSLVF
nr:protein FAM219B isoform X1 [Kogia breviceps]